MEGLIISNRRAIQTTKEAEATTGSSEAGSATFGKTLGEATPLRMIERGFTAVNSEAASATPLTGPATSGSVYHRQRV